MELNLCPYCSDPVNTNELHDFDDDDKEYWHYQCTINERIDFEEKNNEAV